MLFVQPALSFGAQICKELELQRADRRHWQTFEFAAAWVNRAGAEIINEAARRFLAGGGQIRAVVGLDFSSTSYEGLDILLELENDTVDIETFVFFDENQSCTFHPKIYLFSNSTEALLFVGSNNMTGGGLDSNVEATVAFATDLDDETICAARKALENWRQDGLSRSRRLTRELLEQLLNQQYVRTEEEIHRSRTSDATPRSGRGEPLFGRSPPRGGGHGRAIRIQPAKIRTAEVLLMRVRPRRNGGQVQISMDVLSAFMRDATEVISIDGTRHPIGYNLANGIQNTARFEAPEMIEMQNPVARFQWINRGNSGNWNLQYEIFDADSNEDGAAIFRRLEEGIAATPKTNLHELSKGETILSKANREIAQWYRLDDFEQRRQD